MLINKKKFNNKLMRHLLNPNLKLSTLEATCLKDVKMTVNKILTLA